MSPLISNTHKLIRNGSKVLILGGYGQLGSAYYHFCNQFYHNAVRLDSRYDITNHELIDSVFEYYRPEIIINCAAYTNVDRAEIEKEKAMAINAHAVSNLARLCYTYDCVLVHISTDYVFSGSQMTPYTELDQPNPTSHYGFSKLMGEEAIINGQNCRYYILRTGWLYGARWGLLANLVHQYFNGHREFSIVSDTFGGPTYSQDLIWKSNFLIREYAPYGLYHVGSLGACSWYEFIKFAFDELGFKAVLTPKPILEFKMAAKRPVFCALSNEKASKAVVRATMSSWRSGLLQYLSDEFLLMSSRHLSQA